MQSIFDEHQKNLIEQNLLENLEFKSPDQPPQSSKTSLTKSFANLFTKMSRRLEQSKEAEDLKRSDSQTTSLAKDPSRAKNLKNQSSEQSNSNLISSIMNRDLPELESIISQKRPLKLSTTKSRIEERPAPEVLQVLNKILESNDWRDLKKSTAECELQCSRLSANFANRSMFTPLSPLETDAKEAADRNTTSP